jgi:hypothetical protein
MQICIIFNDDYFCSHALYLLNARFLRFKKLMPSYSFINFEVYQIVY